MLMMHNIIAKLKKPASPFFSMASASMDSLLGCHLTTVWTSLQNNVQRQSLRQPLFCEHEYDSDLCISLKAQSGFRQLGGGVRFVLVGISQEDKSVRVSSR
jgi:hypothetical protein